MKIALYTGYQETPWNPHTLETIGLGGTEQSVLCLAKYLAFFNKNEVWVVGDVIEGDYDLVKYRSIENFKQEVDYVDTIISANYINYLLEFEDFNYKNSIFWAHNTDYFPWWRGEVIPNSRELLSHPKLTAIICLTYWHKEVWLEQFPETEYKILVIGNGIELDNFVPMWPQPKFNNGRLYPPPPHLTPKKVKNQYIYSSHAERGLSQVLEDWPQIKQENPDATLKICTPEYGLKYFEENFSSLILNLEGVEFLGTLPQQELYQLMAKSQYWYYPSTYGETFCITALEMLGHKVTPITWEWGGLKETLKGFNVKNTKEEIDWRLVKSYIVHQGWRFITDGKWIPLLVKLNMNLDFFYILSINPNSSIDQKADEISMPGKYNFWVKPGFNGLTTPQSELDKFGVKKHSNWKLDTHWSEYSRRKVTDGEVGCALSHIDAWVDSYCHDREYTFILEDDFQEVNPVPWHEVQTLFERGYDLVYLGRHAIEPENEPGIEDLPNWVEAGYNYHTHAYILSKRATQILVEEYIERYKSKIFAIDEFLPITLGKTFRQDILAEFDDLPRFRAAAPLINFFEQEDSPQTTELNKIYSEIFDYDNWGEWCSKYIDPYILKGQYKLMVDEIGPNVIEFPLFTERFCREFTALAEDNTWSVNRHDYHPTTDQTLESLGLQDAYQRVLEEFVYPIWIWFWELDGENWKSLTSENFIAKYDTINQGSLDIHHDNSLITLNVRLNSEFKGGGTYIPRYKTTLQPKKIGNAMAHPGGITHKHGGRPVEEGTRYILVTFTHNPN